MRFARYVVENERLLVVAASTMIMSLSHTALRPVLPVFAKVRASKPRQLHKNFIPAWVVHVHCSAQGFGVGAAAVGTTISTYAIARLMMNVPAGILADQHGRKPLLVWGPAITALGIAPSLRCIKGALIHMNKYFHFSTWIAGMIGCGLAGTFQQLLMWRWVTGIGSALQMAGAQLFLADISLSSNRARTLGTNQVSHHGMPRRV